MEAQKCSKATDGKGYDFTAKRAASVSVGVLLVTALACAGEPAGRDPNNRPIVVVWPADSRNGAAHKDAAEVLLGRDYDHSYLWNDIHRVTGLGGRTAMEVAQQDAETIVWHCQRALALGVKDEEVYWMLGQGYFLQKRYREASAAARGALQVKPDFYPALHLLIRSHSRAGEYEKALDYCVSARATRPQGISDLHSHYFYSLCRRLTGAGRYATVLSYYEKWADLSSKTEKAYRRGDDDLAQEMSHVKCYLTSPLKGYPPTVTFPRIGRFGVGELPAEEKQRVMARLSHIAVSCSSPNITITAVSIEKKGMLSEAKIFRTWWGAINGEVGAFRVEFKGELKERRDRNREYERALKKRGDRTDDYGEDDNFDPEDLRDEINRTRAEAVKGFLQQAAPHLGIPEDVLSNLDLSRDGYQLTYPQEPTYKGVPLRYPWVRPGFAVGWCRDYHSKPNVFAIGNELYPLPASDMPVKPLVTEKQAREIVTQAMKGGHPGVSQERRVSRPGAGTAPREFPKDEISLCIQPEFISFDEPMHRDLFDPIYEFAEYRLVWIAQNQKANHRVRLDAITGEVLRAENLRIERAGGGGGRRTDGGGQTTAPRSRAGDP